MKRTLITVLCIAGCLAIKVALASTLVRMEFQQGLAAPETVDLKLYDGVAFDTVQNFLNYANDTTANDGNYINSFLHRSVANFVIQGGGFTFDPLLNDGSFTSDDTDPLNILYPGGLQEVIEDPTIDGEFDKSNVAGTIAMATRSGDPNSATSQWFINLIDNSASLDPDFTVFGEVIGDGMTVINSIASQPAYNLTSDIHPSFGALPLVGYTASTPPDPSTPVVEANLIRQTSISELLFITSDIDFGAHVLGTFDDSVITITNLAAADLMIGNIADVDTLSSPFSLVSGTDTCTGSTLMNMDSCVLTVRFVPVTEGDFSDSFNIELSLLSNSYSFTLTGVGALVVEPDITPSFDIVDFGEQAVFSDLIPLPEQIVLLLTNDGNVDLNISSVTLEGPDAADFEFVDNCTQFGGPVIEPGNFCVLPINFIGTTIGAKEASLTVVSDDPDEGILVVPVRANVSIDVDGVSADVEDAAPNNGDGNNDGVLDSIQSNVASLPGRGGEYITLVSEAGITIRAVSMLSDAQLVNAPDNVEFGIGIVEFEIGNAPPWPFNIGLILPEGMIPASYYKYGPTPDDINPHWYEFVFDGATGAEFLGNATLTSPSGNVIRRSLVRLWFEDGQRGDADLTLDGTIVDPGGPEVSADARIIPSSSGSLSGPGIFLFILAILGVRAYRTKAACTRIEQRELMHSTRKSL